MPNAKQLLREALALPESERRRLARELLSSLDRAEASRIPPHPAIPAEGLIIRHASIAYVVVKLHAVGRDCLLLIFHRRWGDWTYPGGHVEPKDADFHAAAAREAEEELAPLRHGEDFEISSEPLARLEFGPVLSPVEWGVAKVYQTAFYSLQFKSDPQRCLERLPRGEFRLAAPDDLATEPDVAKIVDMLRRELADGWASLPLSWSAPLAVDPLRSESAKPDDP